MRELKHWIIPMLAVISGTVFSLGAQQPLTVTGVVSIVRVRGGASKLDNSNAVLWLKPAGSANRWTPSPRPHYKILQQHKRFDPHVLVVPVGTVIDFPNLDPFLHNVFSMFNGKRFDLGLYEAGTSHSVTFDAPGVCYIFCNIHPEMSAVVLVLDTPYYGSLNGAGTFTIFDVPPGRYQMRVWDERALPEVLDKLTHEVVVSETKQNVGMLKITESDISVAHKNKYGRDYDTTTTSSPVYVQP